MKVFMLHTLLLALLVSCGDDGGDNQLGDRDRHHWRNCRTTTSGEVWREFVENVKELRFEEFTPGSATCWESSYDNKLPNCKMKGIFHICDGSTYSNIPKGSTGCSSGDSHENSLYSLVKPTPLNFEAEICGDDNRMVRAQIAIKGKGKQPDMYQFNFELPARYNPIWKQVWKDSDRRYTITVRQ